MARGYGLGLFVTVAPRDRDGDRRTRVVTRGSGRTWRGTRRAAWDSWRSATCATRRPRGDPDLLATLVLRRCRAAPGRRGHCPWSSASAPSSRGWSSAGTSRGRRLLRDEHGSRRAAGPSRRGRRRGGGRRGSGHFRATPSRLALAIARHRLVAARRERLGGVQILVTPEPRRASRPCASRGWVTRQRRSSAAAGAILGDRSRRPRHVAGGRSHTRMPWTRPPSRGRSMRPRARYGTIRLGAPVAGDGRAATTGSSSRNGAVAEACG